jgi:hypothetical protein
VYVEDIYMFDLKNYNKWYETTWLLKLEVSVYFKKEI